MARLKSPPPVPPKPRDLRDVAEILRREGAAVAALQLRDLQAYWLAIMADDTASHKDRLTASRMYADSIGAFDTAARQRSIQPAGYTWAAADTVVDADIVENGQSVS